MTNGLEAQRGPLVVLSGPTGAGKTGIGLRWARHLGGELVGADSVQVYRGFDIGSGKPSEEELGGVQHHLLDVVEPEEPFDAGRFVALADEAIAEVRGRGRIPLVVGGTGLYLRALLRGLAEGIPSEASLRASLNARASEGPEELAKMHDELARVDAAYAARIHRTDPIRIVRGLEVFQLTGVPLSEHHARHAAQAPRYRARWCYLEVPREELRERQRARIEQMLAAGWVDEVRGLLARGVPRSCRPFGSVGYAQVLAFLEGALPERDLLERIRGETWAFARRQRNWFRAEAGVERLSREQLLEPRWLDALGEFARAG